MLLVELKNTLNINKKKQNLKGTHVFKYEGLELNYQKITGLSLSFIKRSSF